jgi:hypothetical protein
MRLIPKQRAALLARLATVIREEVGTEGHHALVVREDIDPSKARQFLVEEAQRMERRVWCLRNK